MAETTDAGQGSGGIDTTWKPTIMVSLREPGYGPDEHQRLADRAAIVELVRAAGAEAVLRTATMAGDEITYDHDAWLNAIAGADGMIVDVTGDSMAAGMEAFRAWKRQMPILPIYRTHIFVGVPRYGGRRIRVESRSVTPADLPFDRCIWRPVPFKEGAASPLIKDQIAQFVAYLISEHARTLSAKVGVDEEGTET